MEILTSFIIKSIIASGVLYFYYQIALKNNKFHSYNRFYLLISIIISLAIPFINFNWFYIEETNNTALTNFVSTINSPTINEPVNVLNTGKVLFGISGLISIFLFLFFSFADFGNSVFLLENVVFHFWDIFVPFSS